MKLLVAILTAAILFPAGASGEVKRLRIERREVILNGQAFGAAGPYEKLVGKVDFALDPTLPQNRSIVDLSLAPRNARGEVEFSADSRSRKKLAGFLRVSDTRSEFSVFSQAVQAFTTACQCPGHQVLQWTYRLVI